MSNSTWRKVYDEETKEYRGCLWRTVVFDREEWTAEHRYGRTAGFPTEDAAESWLLGRIAERAA